MKYLIIFLVTYLPTLSAATFCKGYDAPDSYKKMKIETQKSIDEFSNNKVIASKADEMLDKLITAKSPLVTSWYNKNNLQGKTEEEVSIAWRKYFTQNFILMKYPQSDPALNAEIEKLVDGILAKNFNKKFKTQMEKNFSMTQELAIETINKMGLIQNKSIIEKVKSIKLYWPENLRSAHNNSLPLDLIDWGVAYDPASNVINIGLNSLYYANDETVIAVFSHEIGHSFDSCRWGASFDGPWPFEKVGECLRTETSAGAKKRDDSKMEEFQKAGKISSDLITALKANPTCNKAAYPAAGIQADQLPETFADWFSAEVISNYKKLDISKLRLDLCEDKTLAQGSSYVSNQIRQEKIYYSQPILKALIKESSPAIYCSFK